MVWCQLEDGFLDSEILNHNCLTTCIKSWLLLHPNYACDGHKSAMPGLLEWKRCWWRLLGCLCRITRHCTTKPKSWHPADIADLSSSSQCRLSIQQFTVFLLQSHELRFARWVLLLFLALFGKATQAPAFWTLVSFSGPNGREWVHSMPCNVCCTGLLVSPCKLAAFESERKLISRLVSTVAVASRSQGSERSLDATAEVSVSVQMIFLSKYLVDVGLC